MLVGITGRFTGSNAEVIPRDQRLHIFVSRMDLVVSPDRIRCVRLGHVRRPTADSSSDVICGPACQPRPTRTCPLFVSVLLVSTPVYLGGRTRRARPESLRQQKQRGVAGQKRAPGSRHTTARAPRANGGSAGERGEVMGRVTPRRLAQ